MLSKRPTSNVARPSSRGGFTLVELLVVIGIIAILAGVALGPITNGIKKAQQSGGVQTSRTLALAEFQYANDSDTKAYPDGSGGGADVVAKALIAGNYVSDPGLFYIAGSKETKYNLTTPAASNITTQYISFDFAGAGGTGVTFSAPDQLPIVWSTVGSSAAPALATTGAIAITLGGNMPFTTAGIAVTYKSNNAKFVSVPAGAPNITDVSYPGFTGGTVLSGGATTGG